MRFEDAALGLALSELTNEGLDQLDFGIVEMDQTSLVLRYNATESRFSGLPFDRAVGRNFFRDVAPCTNNRHVAEKYNVTSVDETFPYTFSLRMKPVPVTLRVIKSPDLTTMFLLVQWV